jgi:CheY-like chemotaxis protein
MMSGFEVAAALKSDPNTRDIPILILTAKNLTVDDKAQLNGNVNRVMQKGQAGASELLTWLKRQPARHQGS